MSLLLDIASWALLIAGSFTIIVGGIGLLRMPDFFTRLHPSGLIDTMGAALIVAGLVLQAGFTQTSIKLILIIVFLIFTGPTATHAVAHAALARGLKPWTRATEDNDKGEAG